MRVERRLVRGKTFLAPVSLGACDAGSSSNWNAGKPRDATRINVWIAGAPVDQPSKPCEQRLDRRTNETREDYAKVHGN